MLKFIPSFSHAVLTIPLNFGGSSFLRCDMVVFHPCHGAFLKLTAVEALHSEIAHRLQLSLELVCSTVKRSTRKDLSNTVCPRTAATPAPKRIVKKCIEPRAASCMRKKPAELSVSQNRYELCAGGTFTTTPTTPMFYIVCLEDYEKEKSRIVQFCLVRAVNGGRPERRFSNGKFVTIEKFLNILADRVVGASSHVADRTDTTVTRTSHSLS